MPRSTPSPARHDRLPAPSGPATDRTPAAVADADRSAIGQFVTFVNMTNGGNFAAARASQEALRRLGWSLLTSGREPVVADDDRTAIDWFRTLVSATRDGDRTLARIAARRLYVAGYSVARREARVGDCLRI